MGSSAFPPRHLERLRSLCLALPEATEKEAWGHPTWRVKDRIFAAQGDGHDGRPSLSLKLPAGAQAALVAAEPSLYFVPPYVGHKGWVGVWLDGRPIDWARVGDLLEESYRLIAPKRLVAQLDERPRRRARR